jgi:2-iminobutanoate/2-iminopropanoate deaminase
MKQEIKHPDKPAGKESPYSAGLICDGWLYVSGQGPLDLKTMEIIGESIEEQTRITLDNIREILHAGGCSFDDVIKCTCYISDISDFDVFSSAYKDYFKGIRPARTTVQAVLWGGIKVEIDAIARIPNRKD